MAKIDIKTYFTDEELQKLLAGEEIEENADLFVYGGVYLGRKSRGRENTRKYHATHKLQERQRRLEYLARPEVKKHLAEKARQRRAGNSPYAIWMREYARRKYWEMKADPIAYAQHLERSKVWRKTYNDKHRDEIHEMQKRRYRERTPEQIAHDAEVSRIWEEKNKEKRRQQARARYQANPEKYRQRERQRRAKNRDEYNAKARERRAKKKVLLQVEQPTQNEQQQATAN